MTSSAIRVEGLGKQYRIVQLRPRYGTLRDALAHAASRTARRPGRTRVSQPREEDIIWALRDISFSVQRGEVVGIIGANGAGKSTLLKILSRITTPTVGAAEVRGRVGSLLEVGTGFHGELSGRENIYLSGAILGMRRAEIDHKFDAIVAFAEVEKFIDTPVKRYSSGMYLRLAFAVAAHLEPDILIVDEVLAVGDAAFQRKCLGRMNAVAGEGRTVLFVSHNMTAVQSLCPRVLWLQEGRLLDDGPATALVSKYLLTTVQTVRDTTWSDPRRAPGNDDVRIRSARVRPVDGGAHDPITIRTPFVIELEYWNLRPDVFLNVTLMLYNERGVNVFTTASIHEPLWHGRPFPAGLFRSLCHVPGDLLNDGVHRVEVLIVRDQGVVLHRHENILVFDVQNVASPELSWYGKWEGAVRPRLAWSTECLEPAPVATGAVAHVASDS